MDAFVNLVKPAPFKPSNKDDPEQLLQDWLEYTDQFDLFLDATEVASRHTDGHAD